MNQTLPVLGLCAPLPHYTELELMQAAHIFGALIAHGRGSLYLAPPRR